MQFIIDPAIMSGGDFLPTKKPSQPQFLLDPESEKRRRRILEALSGQRSFENIFETNPVAIKSITTKTNAAGDKTETKVYNVPPVEPIPTTAQGVPVRRIRGTQDYTNKPELVTQAPSLTPPQAYDRQDRGFLSKVGDFLTSPGFTGFLGQVGASIAPESFGGRLGGYVQQIARNQAFDRYLQQKLAGGGASQASPFASGIGLLSPQEQVMASKQPFEELGALSDAAYKEALISGVETPEQMLQRQALITLLGKEPGRPNAGSFQNMEVGPDGKRTPGITHKWLIDDITGEPIKYEGVVGATNPQTGESGRGNADDIRQWYQKAVDEAKRNVDREASQYGKVQTDAFGNVTGIKWDDRNAPIRYQQSYYRHLVKAIKRFQSLGNLPEGFEKPFEQELTSAQLDKPTAQSLE
jgi:hypothetical protein